MSDTPLVLGQYVFERTLGIGSFGKVKLATHTLTKKKVAIKIINKQRIRELDMTEKIFREVRIHKACNHPHIVKLFEAIDTPTDLFIVMEYVSNGELFDYIVHNGKMSEDLARRFFQQIISGIEYLHMHGIVHRDLKPENLLLDQNNNIKIADFGLSNLITDGNFLRSSCGSPNYAAPEVISGQLYCGPEVDIWSVGVILFALVCGSLPFDDEKIPILFQKIKSGSYTIPHYISGKLRFLIDKLLVVDPFSRLTIPEIRRLAWFYEGLPNYISIPVTKDDVTHIPLFDTVLIQLQAFYPNLSQETLIELILEERSNPIKVTYRIILSDYQQQIIMSDDKNSQLTGINLSPQTPNFLPVKSFNAFQTQDNKIMWHLGLHSKRDSYLVMRDVFIGLANLGYKWRVLDAYRIKARIYQPVVATDKSHRIDIQLTLYRSVDSYILDFQRVYGFSFSFLYCCANIIHYLQNSKRNPNLQN